MMNMFKRRKDLSSFDPQENIPPSSVGAGKMQDRRLSNVTLAALIAAH